MMLLTFVVTQLKAVRKIVAPNLMRPMVLLLVLLSLPTFAAADFVTVTGSADNVHFGLGAGGAISFTAPGGISGFLGDFGPIGITSVGQEWMPGTIQMAIASIFCCDTGHFSMGGVDYTIGSACFFATCATGFASFSGTLQVPTPPNTDASGFFNVMYPVTVSGTFSGFTGCPVTGCPSISFNESGLGTAHLFLTTNALGQQEYSVSELDATFPTPEPSTWLLFGSGLAGLAAWRRKKAA